MAKNGMRSGASYKAQYKKYKNNNTRQLNKIAKLERVVKQQPNNMQAKEALDKALKAPLTTYKRRKSMGHECKGLYNMFGYKDNKHTKATPQSKLWHTSPNFSNWFLPSASKDVTANNAVSVWNQFIDLGFKPYGRKYKKSS